jgi:hypothetical protein
MNGTTGQFTGIVTSINVKGAGPNSGQLLFSLLADNGDKKALVVLMDSEARVFTAMTTVLTSAMEHGRIVHATFQNATPTDKAIEIEIARS